MYPYLTIDDNIEVVHSDIQQQEDAPTCKCTSNAQILKDSIRFDSICPATR